ncbi:MAG TPA: hypothetical protein PLE79_05920, partial [Clostridia bacterium]|nr:hypothetical protein [Clostridia bacterium]
MLTPDTIPAWAIVNARKPNHYVGADIIRPIPFPHGRLLTPAKKPAVLQAGFCAKFPNLFMLLLTLLERNSGSTGERNHHKAEYACSGASLRGVDYYVV